MVFIIHGDGIQIVEGNEYPVSTGDVFVLQGHQKHYFKEAGQLEIINVMFDEKRDPAILPEKIKVLNGFKALFLLEPKYRHRHHFKNRLSLNLQELSQVKMILGMMFREQENKLEGYEVILSNLLQELIITISRYYGKIETKEAISLLRIASIIKYLDSRLQEKVYIKELASMAHMSERNFQRIFNKALGISPRRYVLQARLQKASQLLSETDLPVADIAIMTGFSDSNHLIKNFRKSFGSTPYKYRNASR